MIRQLKFISTSTLILVLAIVFGTAPIHAEHGSDSSNADDSSVVEEASHSNDSHDVQASGSGMDSSSPGDDNDGTSHSENETENPSDLGEIHKKGDQMLSEMRKNHKARSAAQRQKQCVAHKKGLTTKFSRIVTNSQRIDDKITSILNEAMSYQQDNNISSNNLSGLIGDANAAAAKTAASIEALKAVTPSLDCNNVSVADDVANFKAAAQQTRDSLKAYRDAVRAVLKVLASDKQTNADEGSAQ